MTSGTGLSNVTHDSLGNMQHKELDGVTWDYTWTPENFLKEVKRNGVVTAQMTYDAWGQRTQKIYTSPDSGEKVTTTYFGKTYEKRTYSNGTVVRLARHTIYIFANGQLIAQVTKEGNSATAYNNAHRWQGEMTAASVFNSHSAKGLAKKVYHYLNAAALHPYAARTVMLSFFTLFALVVLALFLASLRNPGSVSSFSPQLRLASLSILMVFTFSACGGGSGDGQGLYSVRDYVINGDTTLGPPIGTYFYHRNHVNSSSVVTDPDGKEVTRIVYVPFGDVAKDNSSGTDTVTSKFTGQEYDDGIGLYYYNSRYYDPAIGRFISADTIIPDAGDAQTYNPYAYVLNNPVKYIDPTGHDVGFAGRDAGGDDGNTRGSAASGGSWGMISIAGMVLDMVCSAAPQFPGTISVVTIDGSGIQIGPSRRDVEVRKHVEVNPDSGRPNPTETSSSDPETQVAGEKTPSNPQRDGLGSRGGHEGGGVLGGSATTSTGQRLSAMDWMRSTATAVEIASNFFTGRGLPFMAFGPKSAATTALRSSSSYRSVLGLYTSRVQLNQGKPMSMRLGVPGPASITEALANPLATCIGSFTVYFTPSPNDSAIVNVLAYNNTSLTSFGHGLFNAPNELPSRDRTFLGQILGIPQPLTNIREYFLWSEQLP